MLTKESNLTSVEKFKFALIPCGGSQKICIELNRLCCSAHIERAGLRVIDGIAQVALACLD